MNLLLMGLAGWTLLSAVASVGIGQWLHHSSERMASATQPRHLYTV